MHKKLSYRYHCTNVCNLQGPGAFTIINKFANPALIASICDGYRITLSKNFLELLTDISVSVVASLDAEGSSDFLNMNGDTNNLLDYSGLPNFCSLLGLHVRFLRASANLNSHQAEAECE